MCNSSAQWNRLTETGVPNADTACFYGRCLTYRVLWMQWKMLQLQIQALLQKTGGRHNLSLLQGPDKNTVCEEAGAVIRTFSAIGRESRQKTWHGTASMLFRGATDLVMRSDRMAQFMQWDYQWGLRPDMLQPNLKCEYKCWCSFNILNLYIGGKSGSNRIKRLFDVFFDKQHLDLQLSVHPNLNTGREFRAICSLCDNSDFVQFGFPFLL